MHLRLHSTHWDELRAVHLTSVLGPGFHRSNSQRPGLLPHHTFRRISTVLADAFSTDPKQTSWIQSSSIDNSQLLLSLYDPRCLLRCHVLVQNLTYLQAPSSTTRCRLIFVSQPSFIPVFVLPAISTIHAIHCLGRGALLTSHVALRYDSIFVRVIPPDFLMIRISSAEPGTAVRHNTLRNSTRQSKNRSPD